MESAFADVLPLALALAVSPFAIATGVVLLLGERGAAKSALFGAGWFLGILAVATVAYLVVDGAYASDPDATEDGIDAAAVGFGVLFLGLAGLSWRKRPAPGERPREAALLDRLTTTTTAQAFVLGLGQSVVVIKNIPLAVSAGAAVGESGLRGADVAATLAAFSLLATAGVIVPLLGAIAAGGRAAAPLARARNWLEANLSYVTVGILLLLGVAFLWKGVGALT